YERLAGIILRKVNGRDIKDLAEVAEAFKEPKDGLHTVEFEEFPKIIYLDALTAESDNLKLLNGDYRISSLKRIE
ncbi:MAG: PDZ domain-containing protein, partial [Roseimicrobium sp.]